MENQFLDQRILITVTLIILFYTATKRFTYFEGILEIFLYMQLFMCEIFLFNSAQKHI